MFRKPSPRSTPLVQKFALVECINPLSAVFKHHQESTSRKSCSNLIMHYHKPSAYCDGVRKNKTPMELLTEKTQVKAVIPCPVRHSLVRKIQNYFLLPLEQEAALSKPDDLFGYR